MEVSEPVPPFQRFLDANTPTVYRFLIAAVGPLDADDCFQETFLSALSAYPRLRDGRALDRWVLRIASRKAIDHHRAGRRRPRPVREPQEGAVFDPEPFDETLMKESGHLLPRCDLKHTRRVGSVDRRSAARCQQPPIRAESNGQDSTL